MARALLEKTIPIRKSAVRRKESDLKELIKRRLVFVETEQTMAEVVAMMRDQNISSVLVVNQDQMVVGIVTERDIVHKFTLLEKEEKLEAVVGAFMTRPVSFARLSQLEDDVREMFFQKRLRHFPVSDGSTHKEDVLGMLTVTDMTGAYLKSSKNMTIELQREPLVIISSHEPTRKRYQTLFEALKFIVITGSDRNRLMEQAIRNTHPIVFDIDGLPIEEAKKDLAKLKGYQGPFIILSSHPNLVDPLKKLLSSDLHSVALKPLDISYILLLLRRMH